MSTDGDEQTTDDEGDRTIHPVPEPPLTLPPPPGRRTPPSEGAEGPPAEGAVATSTAAPPVQRQAPAPVAVPGARAANPTAVASLVIGLIALLTGIFPITVVFGVVLGILAVALGAIGISKGRRPNTSGTGIAVGGLLTGLIGLVAACVWLAIAISASGADPRPGDLVDEIQQRVQEAQPTRSVYDLQAGDCYSELVGSEIDTVPIVPCDQPHTHEVYALPMLPDPPGAPYPGVTDLRPTANGLCEGQLFKDFVGENYYFGSPLLVSTLFPSQEAWERGDRQVICSVSDPAGPTTGTLRGSAFR